MCSIASKLRNSSPSKSLRKAYAIVDGESLRGAVEEPAGAESAFAVKASRVHEKRTVFSLFASVLRTCAAHVFGSPLAVERKIACRPGWPVVAGLAAAA